MTWFGILVEKKTQFYPDREVKRLNLTELILLNEDEENSIRAKPMAAFVLISTYALQNDNT